MNSWARVANTMAQKATEKPSSRVEENTSDQFKTIHSTPEKTNSTLDEYEQEFERVMQEQENQEICRGYAHAETVIPNCDVSRATSVTTGDKSCINTDRAPCQPNPLQTSTQGNHYEPSANKSGVLAATSGDKSYVHNDRAPCQPNPLQTSTQGNNYEPSVNKSRVLVATSGDKSYVHNDRAPCQPNPLQTSTQGNNYEPSVNKSRVLVATSRDKSCVQIICNKPHAGTTTKTLTQGSGNSELPHIQVDYPPELNPFLEDEIERGKSTNPFGDSGDEDEALLTSSTVSTNKGSSTNPFGDSDYEDKARIPPKPRPRHSVATDTNLAKGLEDRNRLPVPLPRTASKSMPTTPNQSPLLHLNRSFRLPSPSSGASAYNSIRRKKKHAPPPPSQSLQSPAASPKTSSRPRKTRLAPPPPKPDAT